MNYLNCVIELPSLFVGESDVNTVALNPLIELVIVFIWSSFNN